MLQGACRVRNALACSCLAVVAARCCSFTLSTLSAHCPSPACVYAQNGVPQSTMHGANLPSVTTALTKCTTGDSSQDALRFVVR